MTGMDDDVARRLEGTRHPASAQTISWWPVGAGQGWSAARTSPAGVEQLWGATPLPACQPLEWAPLAGSREFLDAWDLAGGLTRSPTAP